MTKNSFGLIAMLLLCLSANAHAYGYGRSTSSSGSDVPTLELRGTYGMWTQSPSSFNSENQESISNWPATKGPSVMGGDLIITPFGLPVVFGMRYENFTSKASGTAQTTNAGQPVSNNISTKLTGDRLSALIGLRADFGAVFFGFLGSVGVAQKAEYDFSDVATESGVSATVTDCLVGSIGSSYSAGAEAGFRLGYFELGVEGGYLRFKVNSFRDGSSGQTATNSDNSNVTMDLSGPYVHGFVGLAF